MVLVHQKLWDAILEDPPDKVTQDEMDYRMEAYEAYERWLEMNNKAYTLILILSSDNCISLVQDITNAKQLWEKYAELYGLSGFSARHNAFNSLYTTNLELCSDVNDYVTKIKLYTQQLSEIGDSIPNWQIISILLNNLGDAYDHWSQQVIQQLRDNKRIDLDVIISQLLDEDQRHKAKESNIALIAKRNNFANRQDKPNSSNRVNKPYKKCAFCKKPGHEEEACFQKNPELKKAFFENKAKKIAEIMYFA